MATKKPQIDLHEFRNKLVDIMEDLVEAREELYTIKDDANMTLARASFLSGIASHRVDKAWDKLDDITDDIYRELTD